MRESEKKTGTDNRKASTKKSGILKLTPYLAGQASRFRFGWSLAATPMTAKKRVDTAIGRMAPAIPAHCLIMASSSSLYRSQLSRQLWKTMLPSPGISRYVFQIHPDCDTTAGPSAYWNHSEARMAMVSSKTLRFRPVVPSAVEPKHALQRDPAALQQQ